MGASRRARRGVGGRRCSVDDRCDVCGGCMVHAPGDWSVFVVQSASAPPLVWTGHESCIAALEGVVLEEHPEVPHEHHRASSPEEFFDRFEELFR